MGWAGAISGAVGLIGANQQRHAAQDAARAQQQAMQQGIGAINGFYNQANSNLQPYMGAGQQGLNGLSSLLAGNEQPYLNSDFFKYPMEQMVKGLDRSAASRSRLNSGGYGVDLAGNLNGLAMGNLGQYQSMLQGMAGLGQQSAMGLGQIGASAGNSIANLYGNNGQAQASMYQQIGDTNSQLIGGLGGIANNWLQGSSYGGGWGG